MKATSVTFSTVVHQHLLTAKPELRLYHCFWKSKLSSIFLNIKTTRDFTSFVTVRLLQFLCITRRMTQPPSFQKKILVSWYDPAALCRWIPFLHNIKNPLASDKVDQNPQLHKSETSKLPILKQIHHTYDRCLKINHIYMHNYSRWIRTGTQLTEIFGCLSPAVI
jgi:hypothetical protein